MRTIKLVIGFEGTRYEGWQSQKKSNTVQEIFEKILKRLFKKKTNLISSSRTDSGVHALGLVAHFRAETALPDQKIQGALNFYLPKDIVVFSAKTVRDSFHARTGAKSKIYRYQIRQGRVRPLFERHFALWHPRPLDLGLMRRAARHLVGRHDFRAFMDRGDDRKNFVRHVKAIRIAQNHIDIEANGFLRHMARIIAGTLIEAGRKKILPSRVKEILLSKDRRQAGPTAKAHGLTLLEVKY